jgi:mono/diheme cytochrome c family protein
MKTSELQRWRRTALLAMAAAITALAACERSPEEGSERGMRGMMHRPVSDLDTVGLRSRAVPAEFQSGEALYRTSCSACHGEAALGSPIGPPLVHPVYRPNHHADIAFVFAAERGVRAHHWGFGDMPPVPEVSREHVMQIVQYVRWLQREAGVY